MILEIKNIYTYYGFYILFGAYTLLTRIYLKFIFAMKALLIEKYNLDFCRYTNNRSYFGKFCYDINVERKISKFGAVNYIIISSC